MSPSAKPNRTERRNLVLHYNLTWLRLCAKSEATQHKILPTFKELKREIKATIRGQGTYNYTELKVLLNLLDQHLKIVA